MYRHEAMRISQHKRKPLFYLALLHGSRTARGVVMRLSKRHLLDVPFDRVSLLAFL